MLRHISVVSIEQAVAAPLTTRLLANEGARVIKLEKKEGDFARNYDDFAQGSSSYFTWLNYGKESCFVDLRKDQKFVFDLCQNSDVVVQNLAPGTTKRLGLDSKTLRKEKETLITLDITGYGENETRKAYDLLVCAEAGLCSITGSENGGPGRVGVSIADIMTGRQGYAAVLGAILNRERTGKGAELSISLFDVVAEMMTVPLLQYRATSKPPSRMGMKHPSIAPYGSFISKDGIPIVLSCQSEAEWKTLCIEVLDEHSFLQDSKFSSVIERVKNRLVLDSKIQAIFKEKNCQEWIKLLEKAKIAFARLNEVSDLSEHPLLRECTVVNEFGKEVKLPMEPVRHIDPPHPTCNIFVPKPGENSDDIRRKFDRK